MDLINNLIGPECGIDIYEETSRDTWVNCKHKAARIVGYIGVAVCIIVIMVILFTGGSGIIAAVLALLAVGLVIGIEFWVPYSAGIEFDRFQREVNGYMTNGASRADAISQIRQERLAREQAQSQLTGFSMLANAISKK